MIEISLNINAIVNKILNNSSSDSSGRDIPATSFDWAKTNLKGVSKNQFGVDTDSPVK